MNPSITLLKVLFLFVLLELCWDTSAFLYQSASLKPTGLRSIRSFCELNKNEIIRKKSSMVLNVEKDRPEAGNNFSTTASSIASTALLLQLAMACSSYFLSPAHAKDDIVRGAEIFTGNCAGCHAGGMNFIKEKKTLKREALEKFVSPTLDKTEVQSWLQKSGQHQRIVFLKAPSGNGKLTEDDFSDVTSFLVDQADKW